MHLFSILPPSFASAFKALCQSTIDASPEPPLWSCFDQLGFIDRYENLIASVCYEQIEKRVNETCTGEWGERKLQTIRDWMAETIVPWMIYPYAKGAKSGKQFLLKFQDKF
jgi:anaphase-promoting complex subunit 2